MELLSGANKLMSALDRGLMSFFGQKETLEIFLIRKFIGMSPKYQNDSLTELTGYYPSHQQINHFSLLPTCPDIRGTAFPRHPA